MEGSAKPDFWADANPATVDEATGNADVQDGYVARGASLDEPDDEPDGEALPDDEDDLELDEPDTEETEDEDDEEPDELEALRAERDQWQREKEAAAVEQSRQFWTNAWNEGMAAFQQAYEGIKEEFRVNYANYPDPVGSMYAQMDYLIAQRDNWVRGWYSAREQAILKHSNSVKLGSLADRVAKEYKLNAEQKAYLTKNFKPDQFETVAALLVDRRKASARDQRQRMIADNARPGSGRTRRGGPVKGKGLDAYLDSVM